MAEGRKTGGRQKGTPNKATAEVKSIARQYGESAIKKLAEMGGLIDGKEAAESETARVSALNTILDRGYGKATQPVSGDEDGPPIKAALTVTFV